MSNTIQIFKNVTQQKGLRTTKDTGELKRDHDFIHNLSLSLKINSDHALYSTLLSNF